MQVVFIYGQPASGKLTIGREVARRLGFALFHNHLIVDALLAVFQFGSDEFIRLRERFWIDTMIAAARAGRSLVFTFAPEPTVKDGFPLRLQALVAEAGGELIFIRLEVSDEAQEQRLADPSRARFGKLRNLDRWRSFKSSFKAALRQMPEPALSIDTTNIPPAEAAARIGDFVAMRRKD